MPKSPKAVVLIKKFALFFVAISLFMQPLQLGWAQVGAASGGLPQLGDGQEMSLAAEKKLGLRIARELYRDPDYIDDALLGDYVQRIWRPLVAAAVQRGDIPSDMAREFAWEILLGKDKSINAFALPGGYFGLHLGLVATVASRDELASVLAHEITHVAQRHIARSQSRQAQQAPWLLAAIILGSVAASKNPEAASAVISGAQAVGAQTQLNYSREMEREADRIGFSLMREAGFDTQGFVGMFDKLQQASRINDSGSFPYLRSHPLTTERLGDMQARLQLDNSPSVMSSRVSLGEHAEHLLMAARARVLSDGSAGALRAETAAADAVLRQVGTQAAGMSVQLRAMAQLYAGAMAAVRLRQLDAAQRYSQAARELADNALKTEKSVNAVENISKLAIELIALEIEVAVKPISSERVLHSLERIQTLAAATPGYSRTVLLVRAQASLSLPQSILPAPVIDLLQSRVADQPMDALAWAALSQLHLLQATQPSAGLRSLRALAESRMAVLDYSGALDRLKAAQEIVRQNGAAVSHVDASIIDTRTRQVQSVLRELQLEK
jgi:predicted Zn-dependent protease